MNNPKANLKGHLLNVLGLVFGVAVTIGLTIGPGILRVPSVVAAQLPSFWMFISVWIIGGLYAFICAPSFIELGTSVRRSGGLYVFAQRALGNYAGFVVGYSDWLVYSGTIAFFGILSSDVLKGLFPSLRGYSRMVAFAIVIVFPLLQYQGIKSASRIQTITSALKVVGILLLAITAFTFGSYYTAVSFNVMKPDGIGFVIPFILALQIVIFTYDCYYSVVYFAEEFRDPARDIPRSVFRSVWLIMGLYLFINLAFAYVLPPAQMAKEAFVGGAVAKVVFGASGEIIISILTLILVVGSINAQYLGATRVLFAMSNDGLFPKKAAIVNKGGTPTVTLFMTMFIAMIFLLSESFEKVLSVITFFIVFNYMISFVSVFVLRRKEPDLQRPYMAWGYPWTTIFALMGTVVLLAGAVIADTRNSIYALIALLVTYPAFLIFRKQILKR